MDEISDNMEEGVLQYFCTACYEANSADGGCLDSYECADIALSLFHQFVWMKEILDKHIMMSV